MINDIVLQKKIKHAVSVMQCRDYSIDEITLTVGGTSIDTNVFDDNTVSIINQDEVEQDITARTVIIAEDNIVSFSKSNFKQKSSGQTFRGKLHIVHKSGTFMPYQLNIITIKPIGV